MKTPLLNQSSMSPQQSYQQDLDQGEISADKGQQQAVVLLDDVYQRLIVAERQTGLGQRIANLFKPLQPQKGLYLWGGVGRGKTYLMDMFFEQLPTQRKMRLHFHRFMHQTHQQLNAHKGQQDPLIIIADELADKTRVICFDEFFVSDITDAMILGGLFEQLFKRGVSLIATSNIPPHRLYWNGLQRERFIPAIKLIEQHCEVFNLDSGIDYRLRTLQKADIFHTPHDQVAIDNLNHSFDLLADDEMPSNSLIDIENRPVRTIRCAQGVVWFKFAEICETARSQTDYIELSRCFQTVMVSDIPQLASKDDAATRRLISLVDEFYERHVNLMITAAVPLEALYSGQRLAFEFKRTVSRLQEMQSKQYLALEHLA